MSGLSFVHSRKAASGNNGGTSTKTQHAAGNCAQKNSLFRVVAVCLALIAAMSFMSGCRDNDALREIIYDITASTVDYDNEEKLYISNDQSEIESDRVSSSEVSDTVETTEETQHLVVYSSDPNSPDFTAKQSLWSENPDFSGIEASSAVNFYKEEDPEVSEELETELPEEELSLESETSQTAESGGSDANDEVAGASESPTAENTEAESVENGASDNGEGGVEASDAIGGPDGLVDSNLTGDYVDIPRVDSIAAYGDVAVLVQMIGGSGALAAADNELLNSSFSSVFARHGSASIVSAWSDDGTDGACLDVNAIIGSGADCLLVFSGAYLTEDQFRVLTESNVEVYEVYAMTNSKYIKENAQIIGEMLSESTAEYASTAMDRAAQYVSFYNNLIADVCATANGGSTTLAGNATYENKNSTNYSYDSSAKYTLLIDGYDTTASYAALIDGWAPTTNGAALATVGYDTSPVSFYIQAGGLINTAAYKGGGNSGQVIVWQFNSNIASFEKSKWSYASGGLVDKSLNITVNAAGAWNMSLLTADYGTSGSETSVASTTNNFGTDSYPVIIAATQEIKTEFIEGSADENGIYHPYSLVTEGVAFTFFGKRTSGGSSVYSAVGVDSSARAQVFSDGKINDDAVVVNPHGLFSSWTEDGSPESVLEAAWVCDVVNEDSGTVDWKSYVKEFYSIFYDYDLSDAELATIEAGLEA